MSATLLTFWVTGHFAAKTIAIAIGMAIAAAKVIVVLNGFMALGRAALPLRIAFYIGTVGCAGMIWGIACLSG